MDSKGIISQKSMSQKTWFWIRIILTAIVVFILWWFIAPGYISMISAIIKTAIKSLGFYTDKNPKLTDALMSPAIPFIILMIGTWGTRLFVVNGKPNTRLMIWFFSLIVALVAFSVLGQYLAVYMAVSNTDSMILVNIISLFISTLPVFLPVVAWLALSYKELQAVFLKKQSK